MYPGAPGCEARVDGGVSHRRAGRESCRRNSSIPDAANYDCRERPPWRSEWVAWLATRNATGGRSPTGASRNRARPFKTRFQNLEDEPRRVPRLNRTKSSEARRLDRRLLVGHLLLSGPRVYASRRSRAGWLDRAIRQPQGVEAADRRMVPRRDRQNRPQERPDARRPTPGSWHDSSTAKAVGPATSSPARNGVMSRSRSNS